MQVTSLFATFFAFFTLVAPLATQARIIAVSRTGNVIGSSKDSAQPFSWFQKRVASASPSAGPSATDSPKNTSGGGMGPNPGAVAGGVIIGVAVFAALIFGALWYRRRQQHQLAAAAPVFNLEAGFHPHARSFSSTSGSTTVGADPVKAARDAEEDKAQWEVTLEEQFARARAQTPDIQRGMTPLPRNESPLPLTMPPRSFRRDTDH